MHSSTKTTLVLLPGLLCRPSLFAAIVPALSSSGRTILCPPFPANATMVECARMVLNSMPNTTDRFALAGLSAGGYMALAIAALAPERIAGLGLLHTQARADSPEISARRAVQAAKASSDGLTDIVSTQASMLLAPRSLPLDVKTAINSIDDKTYDMPTSFRIFARDALLTGAHAFVSQQAAITSRIDKRETISKLRVPVCIVTGEFDGVTPPAIAREMHALATAAPFRSLTIIPDCGHLSPLEDPDALLNALIPWLHAIDAAAEAHNPAAIRSLA